MEVNNNSDIESILSSNNNAVDRKTLERAAEGPWLKRSVVNRSLFLDNVSEIITILFPKHMEEQVLNPDFPARDDANVYMINIRTIKKLKSLYVNEVTKETIKQFIDGLQIIIHIAKGDIHNGRSWKTRPGCLYTGIKGKPVGGLINCKNPSLDSRTSKFIDIISNTILLYFKKVSKTKKELLENKNFIKLIGDFADLLASLYYFTAQNYSGKRLCNRFSNLVKNINAIFGYPIIVQTGINGEIMCGHGIVHVTKDDTHMIAIHYGNANTGSIHTNSLIKLGYAVGGTRKQKNHKRTTRKSKYSQ